MTEREAHILSSGVNGRAAALSRSVLYGEIPDCSQYTTEELREALKIIIEGCDYSKLFDVISEAMGASD